MSVSDERAALFGGRDDFSYVYGVPGREDGMRYAVTSTRGTPTMALFRDAGDCQLYVEAVRATGERVEIMPSAGRDVA